MGAGEYGGERHWVIAVVLAPYRGTANEPMVGSAWPVLRGIICRAGFVSLPVTMNCKDYIGLVNPRLIPAMALVPPPLPQPSWIKWHLRSCLLSWCTASRSPAGLRRAGCTWWSSHMSWRSPGWRWPPGDTSCPGRPAAMAVCPWETGTSHCCLRGRKKREFGRRGDR